MKELNINIENSIIESITRYASVNKLYDTITEMILKSGIYQGCGWG